ncbi:MAG: hypothetical protein RR334_03710 [Clostridia bacterium]
MVIGVDIDGVLFDTENFFRTKAELHDISIKGKGMFNFEGNTILERYDWSKETMDDFYNKYFVQIFNDAPLFPYAKEVFYKLKADGHKLIAITARGIWSDIEIDITNKRLAEEGIVFDKLIYNQKNKLDACIKEKVEVMIDDRKKVLINIANNGIKCLYFRTLVLDFMEHENVTEVRNWGDVYRYFINLKK